jgi:uncharacterized protein YbcI
LTSREFVTVAGECGTEGKRGPIGRIPSVSFLSFVRPESQEGGENEDVLSDLSNTQKGSMVSAISGAMVQLMREYTGRGPTRARTYINEDLISVVLQDTLTMGERSLVRDGEVDLVLASRKAFQRTMSQQLIAAIEEHSGRRVLAFLSANHIDPDIALESFVLVPRSGNGASAETDGSALA